MDKAIEAWNRGGYVSKAACAREFGVTPRLFIARLQGRGSRRDRVGTNQRLTPDETKTAISFILKMDSLGINRTPKTIETIAWWLIEARPKVPGAKPPPPLGGKWANRFMLRYKKDLMKQSDSTKEIDQA
jgi:hypothetical protein